MATTAKRLQGRIRVEKGKANSIISFLPFTHAGHVDNKCMHYVRRYEGREEERIRGSHFPVRFTLRQTSLFFIFAHQFCFLFLEKAKALHEAGHRLAGPSRAKAA